MTFAELMALDKKPDKTKPVADQSLANSTAPEKKTVRPVRAVRPVRSTGSKRSLPNKRRVRNDYPNTPSKQPAQREIKRHAFEVYKDQVERLQELKVATMKTGELRSMSDMVREALDNFLKKQ
jgi:hypothetical protein